MNVKKRSTVTGWTIDGKASEQVGFETMFIEEVRVQPICPINEVIGVDIGPQHC